MQRYVLHAGDPTREIVLGNLRRFIDRLPEGKSWKIEIREHRAERSDKQNRALWGVAYPPIMEATGLEGERDKLLLHEHFCELYFGHVDHPILGRRPRRTTTRNEHGERDPLDKVEMASFYDFVQRQAAGFGIDVPDPAPPRLEAA